MDLAANFSKCEAELLPKQCNPTIMKMAVCPLPNKIRIQETWVKLKLNWKDLDILFPSKSLSVMMFKQNIRKLKKLDQCLVILYLESTCLILRWYDARVAFWSDLIHLAHFWSFRSRKFSQAD